MYNIFKKTILVLLLGFKCCITNVYCQSTADSNYIKYYPQKYYISGYLLTSYLILNHDGVSYFPNIPLNTGVGFAVKNSLINVQYSYGAIPLGGSAKGKTKSLDMQMHHYGRKWVYDVYIQNYKGFYTTDGVKESQNIHLFPDLKIKQIGGELQYFKNGSRFSPRAAFEQSEQQIKTAGSLVLGGNAYYYAVDLGNTFPSDSIHSFNNLQIGFSSGYAYSWVFKPQWLWSSIVYAGINTGNDLNRFEKLKWKIYPNVTAKTSVGYHAKDWGAYFSMLLHNKSLYFGKNENIQVLTLNMQLTYVKHFGR